MKTVGAFEAKACLSQLLSEVEHAREPVLIQRRGRSVAVLVAYADFVQSAHENAADHATTSFRAIRERARPAAPGVSGVKELIAEGRER